MTSTNEGTNLMDTIKGPGKVIFFNIQLREFLPLDDARLALVSWILMKKSNGTLITDLNDWNGCNRHSKYEKMLIANFRWLGFQSEQNNGNLRNVSIIRQASSQNRYLNFLQELHSRQLLTVSAREAKKNEKKIKNVGTKESGEAFNTNIFFEKIKDVFKINSNHEWEICLLIDPEKEREIRERINSITGLNEFPRGIILWNSLNGYNQDLLAIIDAHVVQASSIIRKDSDVRLTVLEIMLRTLLDWPMPEFVHIPLLKKEVTPIGPRCTLEVLRREGYLSNALRDVLCGCGSIAFNSTEPENMDEFVHSFNLSFLQHNGCTVCQSALDEINHYYLTRLDIDQILRLCMPFLVKHQIPLENKSKIRRIIGLLRNHLPRLMKIAEECRNFFTDNIMIQNESERMILRKEISQKVLWSFQRKAKSVDRMTEEVFFRIIQSVQYETGIMGKDLWLPIRLALTGSTNEYELAVVAEILGKELCIQRIHSIVGDYW